MNRSKKLIALFGVLVVAGGVTFGVTRYEESKEKIKNSDTVIMELDTESVTALSWNNETTELAFHKDDTWIYDGDDAFPVDSDKMEDLLDIFKEFGVSFVIEDVEDYSQYGLDDPVCSIQITTSQKLTDESDEDDKNTLEILLGDFSKMDSQRYVSIGDGNVYLVKNDPLDQFSATLSDMIKNDTTPDFEQVDDITFAGDISYHIDYEEKSGKSYQDEDVYFVKDGDDTLPLDTSLVDSYLNIISNLSLTEYATYNATEEELTSYGLDSPDLSITVNYTYETEDKEKLSDVFVLSISRDPEEKAAAEKNAEKGTDEDAAEEITAYVRVGESQIVYKLDGSNYEELMEASYNDLRHQSLFYGDFADVYQIDISLEDGEYSITSEKEDDDRIYYYDDEELDLENLSSKIKSLTADEFTEVAGDGKKEIRLTLYLENDDFPKIEIVLYRHDGENCIAEVNGKTVAYISRADVVDLIEAIHSIVL